MRRSGFSVMGNSQTYAVKKTVTVYLYYIVMQCLACLDLLMCRKVSQEGFQSNESVSLRCSG